MDRIIYYEPFFTPRRQKLIGQCIDIQNRGLKYIYILPSREAISEVRSSIISRNNGILGQNIITFDQLEEQLTKDIIKGTSIDSDARITILSEVCKKVKSNLKYYNRICIKDGFIGECARFIKSLKRQLIGINNLKGFIDTLDGSILKYKLHDLYLIYEGYERFLKNSDLYDIDDISEAALDAVSSTYVFNDIDTIIIDGFIHIDPVNIKLVQTIADSTDLNIYVNSSFKTPLTAPFLDGEIIERFKDFGFTVIYNDDSIACCDNTEYCSDAEYCDTFHTLTGPEVNDQIKEVCTKFLTGTQAESHVKAIQIKEYPCIEAEVRECARHIKKRLIDGIRPDDIAVYVNNSRDYASYIKAVSDEFGIPISLPYSIPLIDSQMTRNIIYALDVCGYDRRKVENWIVLFKTSIGDLADGMQDMLSRMFNEDLSFDDKVLLKSYDALLSMADDLRFNMGAGNMLNNIMEKDEFINILKYYSQNRTISIEEAPSYGVRVINTDLARGQHYCYVYILGVNDGEIPMVSKPSTLFNSDEVKLLLKWGINYDNYMWELYREKIRFCFALGSAIEGILLSYRSTDEGGAFLIPSPFIDELKYICHIKDVESHTMRDRFSIGYDNVMSVHELTMSALQDIFSSLYSGGSPEEVTDYIKNICLYDQQFKRIVSHGSVEYHRSHIAEFNNYEGVVGSQTAGLFKEDYTSSTRITGYFRCPYAYMLENIMSIGVVDTPEDEYTAMEVGNFYHDVLCSYYKESCKLKPLPDVYNMFEFKTTLLDKIFEAKFSALRTLPITSAQLDIIKEDFRQKIHTFIENDLERLKQYFKITRRVLIPSIFEKSLVNDRVFGIKMRCKIDRIDLEYEIKDENFIPTGRFVICDYKKKNVPNMDKFLQREDCQLAIYYYMVMDELKKKFKGKPLECMGLIYLGIEDLKKKDGIYRLEYKKEIGFGRKQFGMDAQIFELFLEYLRSLVIDAVKGINEGMFYYAPDCPTFAGTGYNTQDCPYKDICRYNRDKVSICMENGGRIQSGGRYRSV